MGGGAAALQKDVPWRASSGAKPIPKIHYSPILRIPQNPLSDYALSIMKVRFFFFFFFAVVNLFLFCCFPFGKFHFSLKILYGSVYF